MKPLSYIISALIGVLVGYLSIAFYEVSFDISNWTEGSRFAGLMMMFFLGSISCVVCAFANEDQNQ